MERAVVVALATIYIVHTVAELADMIGVITLHPDRANAFSLLSSAVAVWIVNVLVFSLLYWQMDRGGPRGHRTATVSPDWIFPRSDRPDGLRDSWRAEYVDCLYLSFTTCTAFSPADAAPISRRAKMLMMLESAISMVTLVVVVSRAINVLPG